MQYQRLLAANLGDPGLTVYCTVYDVDDNPLIARTATGVVESPAGSGLYRLKATWDTAWTAARVVWDDDNGHYAQETVNPPALLAGPSGLTSVETRELLLAVLLYNNAVTDHGDGTRTFQFKSADGTATLATVTHRPADGLRTSANLSP